MKKLKIVLILTLTILFNACSSDSNNEEAPNNNASEYLYYVSGKMNGENFIYGQKTDDTALNFQEVYTIPLEGATCAYSKDQGLDYKISYSTTIYPDFDNETTQPLFGIDFIRFYRCSDTQSSSKVFNDLFSVGNYEFSNDDESYGIMKQVGITYAPVAAGGDTYYTTYGGSQSSSTFKITKSEESNFAYNYSQTIEGEFSAKLYNSDDSSEFIEITEGKFKISITK